uniref:Putative 7.8-9.7 kDa secreted peptide n=1 Tax=Psorophora albipes TaxID=869069 RepID=T1E2S9_9DIPT
MELLFAFPCLLAALVLIAGSSSSAAQDQDCSYIDCDVIDFRLPQGLVGGFYRGYCECVDGTGLYTGCGEGKVFDVKTESCADPPPKKK